MSVGIEAINVYTGRAFLDVRLLFEARGFDLRRFENLAMRQRSVNLPCEDAVTNGVNAAKPLLDRMTPDERDAIELLVVGTESGVDLGKPISTYIHDLLGLSGRARSFEVKHACYSGTAALQTAAAFVASAQSRPFKALVIATDASGGGVRGTYWEPSTGAGAVAMVVGAAPTVFELDPGASGFHTYEVMDTLRPRPDHVSVDADLSLRSYLTCLERSYEMYEERVAGADLCRTFNHLVFHTPFAGMVKGAHRQLMRSRKALPSRQAVDEDFDTRLGPSLLYASRVGNLLSASLYLALCSLLDHVAVDRPKRIGMFSYGSGCASEFFSGVVRPQSAEAVRAAGIGPALDARYELSRAEYERVVDLAEACLAGIEDVVVDPGDYGAAYDAALAGRGLLVLDRIKEFHREYRWS